MNGIYNGKIYFDMNMTDATRNAQVINLYLVSETGKSIYFENSNLTVDVDQSYIDSLDLNSPRKNTRGNNWRFKGSEKDFKPILNKWILSLKESDELKDKWFTFVGDCIGFKFSKLFELFVYNDNLEWVKSNIMVQPEDFNTILSEFLRSMEVNRYVSNNEPIPIEKLNDKDWTGVAYHVDRDEFAQQMSKWSGKDLDISGIIKDKNSNKIKVSTHIIKELYTFLTGFKYIPKE